MYTTDINLHGFGISIFKKNQIIYTYIYNTNYYCFIKISNHINVKLKNKNTVGFSSKKYKLDNIKPFITQFYVNEFSKIKFTGKGYKIKKNTKNSLILLFIRAHTTVI